MNQDALKETPQPHCVTKYKSPCASLVDEIYRERLIRARRTSPEEKFLAGGELFEYAGSITPAGMQNENPDFTQTDCRREPGRRLKLRERMERGG